MNIATEPPIQYSIMIFKKANKGFKYQLLPIKQVPNCLKAYNIMPSVANSPLTLKRLVYVKASNCWENTECIYQGHVVCVNFSRSLSAKEIGAMMQQKVTLKLRIPVCWYSLRFNRFQEDHTRVHEIFQNQHNKEKHYYKKLYTFPERERRKNCLGNLQ